MIVIVEVLEGAVSMRQVELEVNEIERLGDALARVAEQLGVEHADLLLDIGVGEHRFDPNCTVGEAIQHGHHWHHRRVCIDVHFESEQDRHHFPSRAPWSVVHNWGCKRFDVPSAVCANLQLHEDGPKGPVLNERLTIGHFHDCKGVWLVKPGPEPNGNE